MRRYKDYARLIGANLASKLTRDLKSGFVAQINVD